MGYNASQANDIVLARPEMSSAKQTNNLRGFRNMKYLRTA